MKFTFETIRIRNDILRAVREAILAANPKNILRKQLKLRREVLSVGSLRFDLRRFQRIFVIGGGKASALMATEVEAILGDRITSGVVNVPDYLKRRPKLRRIQLNGASHPIPSESGQRGVERMLRLLGNPTKNDLVLCLISGGASALMPLPTKGIRIEDKQKVTSLMLKSGATIDEINAVRKHLSDVKGGRLAMKLRPATVLSLIISDVVGDRIDSIASGPTAPDETTYQDARKILENYDLWTKIPSRAQEIIRKGIEGKIEETPKPGSSLFKNVHNVIVGSNKLSCLAAAGSLRKSGYKTMVLSTMIRGEARAVGGVLAAILSDIRENNFPIAAPAAILAGGETTVTVRGKGVGGRNQELVLASAVGIDGLENVCVASLGTDGLDGPTYAAGAIADGNTIQRGRETGLNASIFLRNNDSHNIFRRLHSLIITGATGTNVNDLMIAVAGKTRQKH